MVEAAHLNPSAYGDLTGINLWAWILSHISADQKFMTIFSILFGAGIVLMTERMEAKGRDAAGLHYRRAFWLIVIGIMHAYLLWYGDILVAYGFCALVVFLFRKISPKWLLTLGLLSVSVPFLLFSLAGWSLPFWPPEAYQQALLDWKPSADTISEEIAAYQGSWLEQMAHRIPTAIEYQTFVFLVYVAWRAGGLMLVGMALFKWGVLTAKRSKRFYAMLASIGFGLGLPLVIYGVIRNLELNWSYDYSMFFGTQFNYLGSLFISLGYIGAVMLICKSASLKKLTHPLALVGRMALTNYLLQSIIFTGIFYGHGLGLFGEVERSGQILIVFAVWAFHLIASEIWLRHFRFGPFEWLWRSLSYLRLQPMRQVEMG
jgi:uncharacterized protein